MRYSVVHDGVPVGVVELAGGELVAGPLVPLPPLVPLLTTIRAGSDALLALGFFGAATVAGQNGAGDALRAAAALRFELLTRSGNLAPTTFVNVVEAPDGGLMVIARFGHAHATVGAPVRPPVRREPEHARRRIDDLDV